LVSGGLEADGIHELIEIINDALIEPIELRTLLLLQFLVSYTFRYIRSTPSTSGLTCSPITSATVCGILIGGSG
jgi:hypothetical protein